MQSKPLIRFGAFMVIMVMTVMAYATDYAELGQPERQNDSHASRKIDPATNYMDLGRHGREAYSDILVLRLKGTAVGEKRNVPKIDGTGTVEGMCFDVDLIDAATDQKIGDATDCLSDISEVGDGLALVGTTTFYLPQGRIVSRGLTSVQPTTHGSESATHITGAIPTPGTNDVLSGTGVFSDAQGSVRLSGAVDMSNIEQNEITFDCLFILTLKRTG